MKDLKESSGFAVKLNEANKLEIPEELGGQFSDRKLFDLKDVLMQPIDLDGNRDLYYMYRDVCNPVDEGKIKENHLRYDMTVILPGTIGEEYSKTLGHYHPDKEGSRVSYPEVYEVISGRAFYLLQRPKRTGDSFDFGTIEEAFLIEVKAGEKAIMPPDFGHITINLDPEPLVMSNWVSGDFQSDYSQIKNYGGGAYFIVADGQNYKTVKNTKYANVADLKVGRPKELLEYALRFNQPMYNQGIAEISKLEYLGSPEKYIDVLTPENLFDF